MIRTILIPIDGSAHAQLALELGSDIAARYDAELVLLHVGAGDENVPDALFNTAERELKEAEESGADTGIPPHPSHRMRVLGYLGKMLMRNAQEQAERHGVKRVSTEIDIGDAGECIVNHAKDRSADLIVMGSRGFGELTGLVLGSVSHKVFHTAPCSCVTVHSAGEQHAPDGFMSILVPTDGSEQADRAVDLASDIAARYGASLALEYVMARGPSLEQLRASVDMNLLSDEARDALDPEQHPVAEHVSSTFVAPVLPAEVQKEIGEQVLERGRRAAEAKGVTAANLVLVDGDPARKIIQIAKREKADLVAMGSRGLSGAEGLLSGSVSYKVAHTAPCSCMIVR